MTTKYAAEHASALADILDAGTAVTFSRAVDATYDATTDVAVAAAASTIAGAAIEVKGDPSVYRDLSLIHSVASTLLFAPTMQGDRVLEGDTCTWSGVSKTVKKATHTAIAGAVILSRVVCVV